VKTKPVKIKVGDAQKLEQTARELSAEFQQVIRVNDIITELMESLESAKKGIKNKIKKVS
tara:strand:- start:117 stop:296 length:180 start_codon:yes stop_codon:yes gene_type:complete